MKVVFAVSYKPPHRPQPGLLASELWWRSSLCGVCWKAFVFKGKPSLGISALRTPARGINRITRRESRAARSRERVHEAWSVKARGVNEDKWMWLSGAYWSAPLNLQSWGPEDWEGRAGEGVHFLQIQAPGPSPFQPYWFRAWVGSRS